MNYLFSSSRCHDAFMLSSIAVVSGPKENCRRKVTNLAPHEIEVKDFIGVAKMISHLQAFFLGRIKVSF